MKPFFQNTVEVLRPNVAGRFYPSEREELKRDVLRYIAEADIEPSDKPVFSILVPHAGYVFSGPVSGYSFRHVKNQNPDTVLFIAISHQGVEGGCVFTGKQYETPLGRVDVDLEVAYSLLQDGTPLFSSHKPYINEHSVEVNLPFVQTVFPNARVASILITQTNPELCRQVGQRIADTLRAFPQKSILICVSSDMSHYPSYEVANRVDRAILKSLETLDPQKIYQDTQQLVQESAENLHCVLCGSAAVLTAVETAKIVGATQAKILHYRNSGDCIYGDHNRVVGYGSFVIYQPENWKKLETQATQTEKETTENFFPIAERKFLLSLARDSIQAALKHKSFAPINSDPNLEVERGVFVTLKQKDELRGCLGRFEPAGIPLYQLVAIMAVESATHDIRFSAVTEKELAEIDIQISVLTPLEKVSDISEIIIGIHGLQIHGKTATGLTRSGTLLPQVATERNWNVEEFLRSTCRKAGLELDAWTDPQTEIYRYGAEVFGDLDYGKPPFND